MIIFLYSSARNLRNSFGTLHTSLARRILSGTAPGVAFALLFCLTSPALTGETPEEEPLAPAAPAPGSPESQEATPDNTDAQPTIIESDRLEMQAFDDRAHFVFTNNVRVTGTNLTVECDLMEVFSVRDGESEGERDGGAMPALGSIQQIVATGNVRITQADRVATAGRADLYPIEGQIVLSEDPVITNPHGSVSGPRIILYQGESRAVVESEPGNRSRITLPTLPDLGVEARRPAPSDEQRRD